MEFAFVRVHPRPSPWVRLHHTMKSILNIVSAMLILAGGVFFLQGVRILPSPLMYGKIEWVIIGGAMVVVGAALGVLVNLRARAK